MPTVSATAGVGAAAVLFRNGKKRGVLRTAPGEGEWHMVFKAVMGLALVAN